jgi:hypothetical protein
MASRTPAYGRCVFINCPFDDPYRPILHAIVFAVFDCGFVPRCALEASDGGQVRLEKIVALIRGCRFGIHDISRTEPDAASQLPRFNMPFELGLFLGAARFGEVSKQRRKRCLVLDRERYRFQRFISDIAGQDIEAHRDDPRATIIAVRNWLADNAQASVAPRLPGGTSIGRRFGEFQSAFSELLAAQKLDPGSLTFQDYAHTVSVWLAGLSSRS